MSIKVKKSSMVFPAKETPRGSLWLSKLDMIIRGPYSHTNVLFIYSHPISNTNLNNAPIFDTHTLKESLSKTLVPFYPMAGRVTFNEEKGRYEIDCNAQGALFVEVETTHALAELGDYKSEDIDNHSQFDQLRKLVIPKCDYSGGLASIPLLLVQLTRFKCGGVCLGFAQHHHVADGVSHLHFINSWARLTQGLDLAVQPVHDRAAYLAPRDPPRVTFRHLEYEPPLPPLTPKDFSGGIETAIECIFKLTKDQMVRIKQEATFEGLSLSTFVVQAGHVWRSTCKARGLADDQYVKLTIPVDGRSRLKDKKVPPGYCGNILFHATCVEKAGDITRKPLWYVARKVHEAVKRKDDVEYLRSAIDCVESHPDLTAITRGPQTTLCPNQSINSWARLPCHEADFGWGKPNFVGINGIKFEGQSYITPNSNGDGSFFVAIKLFVPHMELFKKYLYEF